MKLKKKIKYLNYNNDKLVTLLLNNEIPVSSQSKSSYSNGSIELGDYNNQLQSKVYQLSIKKDYLYNWLINSRLFGGKDRKIVEKISKELLLKSTFAKEFLNRYRINIIRRLKKIFAREAIEIVAIAENNIFITNVSDENLNKIRKKINEQYKNICNLKDVNNFLKNKSSILYKIDDETMGTNEYHYNNLVMPKNPAWIAEVLKLYFWEKKNIEIAVKKIFAKNPDIFFMYASVYEDIYACDENGKILFESTDVLDKFRKYRLYFSKTGLHKVVIQKQEKYYEKFGFGDINNNLYKVKKVETGVKEFEDYDDIDLESYVDFAKNYIQKNLM